MHSLFSKTLSLDDKERTLIRSNWLTEIQNIYLRIVENNLKTYSASS